MTPINSAKPLLSSLFARFVLPFSVACALLFWASAFPGVRVALHYFSPGPLALARYLVASVALGFLSFVFRSPLPKQRDLPQVALMGLLAFSIYNVAFNYGETRIEAGTASFIVNTAPVFAMLGAMFFLGENIPARSWGGIGLSFAGIGLLTVSKGGLHFEPMAFLLLIPALAASTSTILQKRLLERYQALGLLTATVWCGTFFLLIFTPALLKEWPVAPPKAWFSVLYLGVFPGTLSYALWSWALSRLPVSTVVSFLYLIPPLATLIAWIGLGEVLPPLALCGGALALSGVVLANKGKIKH